MVLLLYDVYPERLNNSSFVFYVADSRKNAFGFQSHLYSYLVKT